MTREILIAIIIFAAGVVLNHLWGRFINRVAIVKYTIWHQYLGTSGDYGFLGSVRVLHNDLDVKNLFTSIVTLSNENNRDLKDLAINIACDDKSQILISYGKNRSSLNSLQLAESYMKVLVENKPETYGYLFARRDYDIPVFNRGDQIEMLLITTNVEGKQPLLTVSCDYPGVKLKLQKQPRQFVVGESQQLSAIVGLFIGLVICVLLLNSTLSSPIAVWIAFVVGGFVALIGAIAIKLAKFVKRVF